MLLHRDEYTDKGGLSGLDHSSPTKESVEMSLDFSLF